MVHQSEYICFYNVNSQSNIFGVIALFSTAARSLLGICSYIWNRLLSEMATNSKQQSQLSIWFNSININNTKIETRYSLIP